MVYPDDKSHINVLCATDSLEWDIQIGWQLDHKIVRDYMLLLII